MNSRRTFLRTLGAAAVGGVAGCGGDGDAPGTSDSDTGGDGGDSGDAGGETTTERTTTEQTTTEEGSETERWTMTQGGPEHTGVAPGAGIGPDRPGVRWERAADQAIVTDPVVGDDAVYVGTNTGRVYALSREDGSVRWRNDYGSSVGLALAGDTLYVSADSVYALRVRDGNRRWRYSPAGTPATAPVVYDGTVYVADDSPRLYAVVDGERKWRTLEMLGHIPQPGVGADGLFMGHGRGLSRIDTGNGTQAWRYKTDSQVTAAPTVADGRVITPFAGGRVVNQRATDSSDRVVAELSQSAQASVAVDETGVYVAGTTGQLHKLSRVDGSERWAADLSGPSYSPPALAGDYVYTADDSRVYAFTRDGGESAWSWNPDAAVRTGVAPVDGSLYVGTREWDVYALTPE